MSTLEYELYMEAVRCFTLIVIVIMLLRRSK